MSLSGILKPNGYNLYCNSLTANEINTSGGGIGGNLNVSGNLTVLGNITSSGNLSANGITARGNVNVSGNLSVFGNYTTTSGDITAVNGVIAAADLFATNQITCEGSTFSQSLLTGGGLTTNGGTTVTLNASQVVNGLIVVTAGTAALTLPNVGDVNALVDPDNDFRNGSKFTFTVINNSANDTTIDDGTGFIINGGNPYTLTPSGPAYASYQRTFQCYYSTPSTIIAY